MSLLRITMAGEADGQVRAHGHPGPGPDRLTDPENPAHHHPCVFTQPGPGLDRGDPRGRSYAVPGWLVGLSALKANAAAAPPSNSATM
jgi:hypothetical protein